MVRERATAWRHPDRTRGRPSRRVVRWARMKLYGSNKAPARRRSPTAFARGRTHSPPTSWARPPPNSARDTLAIVLKGGVRDFEVRIRGSGEYPMRLRDTRHPLELLYYKGDWSLIDNRGVAAVGTREPRGGRRDYAWQRSERHRGRTAPCPARAAFGHEQAMRAIGRHRGQIRSERSDVLILVMAQDPGELLPVDAIFMDLLVMSRTERMSCAGR